MSKIMVPVYNYRVVVLCKHGGGYFRAHSSHLDDANNVLAKMAAW